MGDDLKRNNITENVYTDESGRIKRSLRISVTPEYREFTIREYLQKVLRFSGRQISSLKFREEGIRVNGAPQRVTYVLKDGDILEIVPKSAGSLYLDHGTFTEPPDILYEDGDLLIVNKPSGMVCHPSPGHYADSLANQVAAYCAKKNENWTIRLVGRLDKDTSGAVIFAKNSETAALISRKISVSKTYFALAEGSFDHPSGRIDFPVADDGTVPGRMKISEEGKPAQTFYEVIKEFPACLTRQADVDLSEVTPQMSGPEGRGTSVLSCCSLLKVHIVHGRTHQIRLHLASADHPLAGDAMYGHGEKGKTHAMLHCRSVRFEHPFSGNELLIEAPFPKDWPAEAVPVFSAKASDKSIRI